MKEKIDFSGELKVKQDLWHETPCLKCFETYCCRNLPLVPFRLNSLRDFINLLQTSCYNGIFPVLKKSGEWTFYMKRDCSFLDMTEGKCNIHSDPRQSMICKSYNAHNCWYAGAFSTDRYSTMIPFNTDMIVWFEKRYRLIENRFDVEIDWEELCIDAFKYRQNTIDLTPPTADPWTLFRLSYRKSETDEFLFFPPYQRLKNRNHLELLSFRLSFPGIYLAVTDSCWAFMVRTELNQSRLNLIRQEYFPAISHKDGAYSFNSIMKEYNPFSETGEQWIILQRSDLEILKDLTIFNDSGNVLKTAASAELLTTLKYRSPNRTA